MKQLTTLRLNCAGCKNLYDLSGLGTALRGLLEVETLLLDFTKCKQLADASPLEALAQLTKLKDLRLCFRECMFKNVSPIARSLSGMKALQRFELILSGCRNVADVSDLGVGLQSLHALTTLRLSLDRCAISSIEFIATGFQRLSVLQYLELNISELAELCDLSPLGRGLGALLSLDDVKLAIKDNPQIKDLSEFESLRGLKKLRGMTLELTNTGLEKLTALEELQHLENLRDFSVNLVKCHNLESVKPLATVAVAHPKMRNFKAQLTDCEKLPSAARRNFDSSDEFVRACH
jgi:hypothetical protein